MWRQYLLASASAMTFTGMALAADLSVPPPPPPPIFTWSGLYVGAYGGGEVTHSSYNTLAGPGFTPVSYLMPGDIGAVGGAGSQSLDKGGFTAGGELGYNWQVGMFVLGLETDIGGVTGGTHNQSSGLINGTGSGPGVISPFGLSQNYTNGLIGTVRGRLGVAFDRLLVYGTGGLAYTTGHYSFAYADTLGPGTGFASMGVKIGYTVGGGLEYALTNNVRVKGEFLYTQFGKVTTTGLIVNSSDPTFSNAFTTSARVQEYTARVGLNYRFNWFAPLPVVAKY